MAVSGLFQSLHKVLLLMPKKAQYDQKTPIQVLLANFQFNQVIVNLF